MHNPANPLRLFPIAFLLVGALACSAGPVRVELRCEDCTRAQHSLLDSVFRARIHGHGMEIVDDSATAPQLQAFVFQGKSAWSISCAVNSPRGEALHLSQEHFPGGLAALLRGLDSTAAQGRSVIEAAVNRARTERKRTSSLKQHP